MARKKQLLKPESLPEKWERLSGEHEKAGALLRTLVVKRLEALHEELDAGEKVWHSEVKALAESLKMAIEIERADALMEFRDHNRAIERVKQLGFLIQRPDGAIEVDASVVTS